MATNAKFKTPDPVNETILSYARGSEERRRLKAKIAELDSQEIEIPLIIGGKEVRTGKLGTCVKPHEHRHRLATFHQATPECIDSAVKAARDASADWARMPWEHRVSIFLKAAELLAGPYRDILNASTMLGQSKNVFQAEIDSACEMIDFFRFNARYAQEIYEEQPQVHARGVWNRLEQRPLEGFVFAVTPFNFTSIAGNLPTAPAIMGNTVLWKPASTSVYSNYFIMKLLQEAGLPPGVINFLPGSGSTVGNPILNQPGLAGIHFTGSTEVFHGMWRTIGENIKKYKGYPRIVGETGGKDFIFAHVSADQPSLVTALLRGSYEYQGQKCSAASRAFIPRSLWKSVSESLRAQLQEMKMGPVEDFSNFVNAVIDQKAFKSISGYIEHARTASDAQIFCGGTTKDQDGYFIEPTVILCKNPNYRSMSEEIFGPVLSIYVYEDSTFEETLKICDEASPYALTGAVFAQDRTAIVKMSDRLVHTAGNFYINDKPTGAVVGQQPFGGSRASGTNDKAGSKLNLLRWVTPRTIKENFVPPSQYPYPFMTEP
ncbi:MAG: L-glutamate gamma-semialdehyde dehydrogenase [Planctomycetota bacterium]